MSLFDDYEPDPFRDDGEPDEDGVTCDRCGEDGLTWVNTGVRSRLVEDGGRFHVCKPTADDFEDISQ